MGRNILYSTGTDLVLRSWHLESLEEVGVVQVCGQVNVPTVGRATLQPEAKVEGSRLSSGSSRWDSECHGV